MESAKAALNNITSAITGSSHSDDAQQQDSSTNSTSTPDNPTSGSDLANESTPATEHGSRTAAGGAHEGNTQADGGPAQEAQHTDVGGELEHTLSGPRDPAVQGEDHPKMTGEGAPGSHSAVFGLTPDGKKIDK